ncbi:MAG: hypothetical protein PHQ93_06150 [Sulfurimonas sp.]|uniref:hypothetical protein n=1 Tax=Sulfurimonas sp. TaxID=2022749 RepID=UPI002619DE35|nr:hypothetical protein [Sulfurimonas sp.]MDD5400747.1 hypothetical protein [Sulfurimonas sp.]
MCIYTVDLDKCLILEHSFDVVENEGLFLAQLDDMFKDGYFLTPQEALASLLEYISTLFD